MRDAMLLGALRGAQQYAVTLDFRPSAEAGKTPLLQGPVRADNAGKWQQRLSPRQLRVFEGGAAQALRRFGFDLATPGHALPLAWRAGYRVHNRLLDLIHGRRRRAQGLATAPPPA